MYFVTELRLSLFNERTLRTRKMLEVGTIQKCPCMQSSELLGASLGCKDAHSQKESCNSPNATRRRLGATPYIVVKRVLWDSAAHPPSVLSAEWLILGPSEGRDSAGWNSRKQLGGG